LLGFDLSPGRFELFLPFLEDAFALLNDVDSLKWLLLEDLGDIDLGLDLLADLVGDALKDVLHLGLVLVDVSGDGPDQLEAGEKGGKSLLDHSEVTVSDVLELTFQGGEELDEVLGLSVVLLELGVLRVEVLQAVTVCLLLVGCHDLQDSLDWRQIQLLE